MEDDADVSSTSDASISEPSSNTGLTVREGGSQLGPRSGAEVRKLERGEQVGRYLVLDLVGEGGMGVVYAAYDPELDRKVAIKLLQARVGGSGTRGDQAWLLREAQAMARLQHPNVLAVHDVGTLGGDRVFVAMELVDGTTLRKWLRGAKRPWREVLPVMRGAGAGLVAAHAAGLVHRDFKPDNVLVGNDGRVRVMDFGLARLRAEAGDAMPASRDSDPMLASASGASIAANAQQRSPLVEQNEEQGVIAGTPAYMAPELYRGGAADERSDQFAFGVALYEALYRVRPYDKKQLADPAATPVPRPPPASDVPANVARAVMRAIAVDPAARLPTIAALLDELVEPPRRSRLALGLGVGAVGIAGALAIGLATRTTDYPDAPPDPCAAAAGRLAGVWDDRVRATTREAFAATKSPLADAGFTLTGVALDRYADAWKDAATDSCRATRVRHEQPEDVMVLRASCLDERRDELRAFTALLGKADAALVEKAGRAAASLDPIARCADVAALRAPGTPPANLADKLGALRGELATAKAAVLAGKVDAATKAAATAVDHASALGWAPVIADAQLVRGAALQIGNHAADAQAALAEAVWAGLRGRRDDVVADASILAAQISADGLAKDGEARIWLGVAKAVADRVGDRALAERWLEVSGIVAGARGDYLAAPDAPQQALHAAIDLADPERIASAEGLVAATLSKSGEFAKAVPHYEHAIALREAAVGKDHPDIALLLTSVGASYDHMGDAARARAALTRALAIRETVFGKQSPRLVATLNNLADMMRRRGELADATATIDRAFQIASVAPGTGHPLYHIVATTRAEVLEAAGRLDDARAALDAVIGFEEKAKSPVLATSLASRAEVALAERKWAEAATFDARSIALTEAANGKDASDLWKPLAGLARAKAGAGDAKGAREVAQRAVKIARAAQITDEEIGEAVALAR